MRKTLIVLVLLGAAFALEGQNGSTATQLFTAKDVVRDIVYPAGFAGVEWGDLQKANAGFELGTGWYWGPPGLAPDASGDLFILVSGFESLPGKTHGYTGLIRHDGTGYQHLVQDFMESIHQTGVQTGIAIHGMAVSPVTAGLLTAGHPVVVRFRGGSGYELWTIDPTTSPATETLVHEFVAAVGPGSSVAVAADGSIYVAKTKLTFTGTDYDESVLFTTDIAQGGWTLGSDGALYAFQSPARWGAVSGKKTNNTILRIDPATGASAAYASVSSTFINFNGWTWDSNGKFWIGLRGSEGFIAEVTAGATIKGSRGAIATTRELQSIGAGIDGELYTIEWNSQDLFGPPLSVPNTIISRLEPGEGGSDGGGKGGGKGKNK